MKKTKALEKVLELFSQDMKARLDEKEKVGWKGWNRNSENNRIHLLIRLMENTRKRQWIDVANLAMFLWNLERCNEE